MTRSRHPNRTPSIPKRKRAPLRQPTTPKVIRPMVRKLPPNQRSR
jgi:hypothetical protein